MTYFRWQCAEYTCPFFSSYAPYGFESSDVLRHRQHKALRTLHGSILEESNHIKTALDHVLAGPPPSTDVGVTRLLGEHGYLAKINPCREPLPGEFYDTWDGNFGLIQNHEDPLITQIERRCAEIWEFLEQEIESVSHHTVFESNWALRRWSSNFLLHLGALIEGRTAWSSELDEFLQLLKIVTLEPTERSIPDKRRIRELDNILVELLDSVGGIEQEPGTIQLSENVRLTGDWVKDKLKPRVNTEEKAGSLSISIRFGGSEHAALTALMFYWLSRRAHMGLDPHCFPKELLTGAIDARVRAASESKYSIESDGLDIKIETDQGEVLVLERIGGDVGLTHENTAV